MALVTRQFPPSVAKSKKAKRRKHIMLAGGREGPEVAAKQARTARFVEGGSPSWTSELAAEKTPEDARTQPPFLRAMVRDHRAYARGLMSVKDTIELLDKVVAYNQVNPDYAPLIEFTGVTTDGKLASFSGLLLEPMVNTMSRDASSNWTQELRKLADELRMIEAAVPRLTKIMPAPQFAFVPRVYLNMSTSVGRQVSVPVEQMAVVFPESGVSGLAKAEVVGTYSPGPEDTELKLQGKVMNIGEPIRVPVDSVDYVTVDPPKFARAAFMETPAFARSRGFVIELTQDEIKRTRSTEARFVVPYDRVLRVRMIYPPAEGYSRAASRALESVDSVAREIEAASNHLIALREQLAYKTLARLSSPTRRTVIITDEVSGFRFGLQSPTFEGATNPVMVWMPFVEDLEDNDINLIPPQGEYNLVGRRVTPIDYIRLLRAARPEKGLRALRKFRSRR